MRLGGVILALATLPALGAEAPRLVHWHGKSRLVAFQLSSASRIPPTGWLIESSPEETVGMLAFINPVPPKHQFRYSGPYALESELRPESKPLAQIRSHGKHFVFCVMNPHEPESIDLPFKWDYCAELRQRPNKSSKPTPLRGAA